MERVGEIFLPEPVGVAIIGVQVQGNIVNAGADIFFLERLLDGVTVSR